MPTWCNNVIYWRFRSLTCFGHIRPSSGAHCCIKLAFNFISWWRRSNKPHISVVHLSWIQAAYGRLPKISTKWDQDGARLLDILGYYRELSLSSAMSAVHSFFHAFTTTNTFFHTSPYHCNQDGNKYGKYQLRTVRKISALLIIIENVQTGMAWRDVTWRDVTWRDVTWPANLGVVWFRNGCHITSSLLHSSLNRTCKLIRNNMCRYQSITEQDLKTQKIRNPIIRYCQYSGLILKWAIPVVCI